MRIVITDCDHATIAHEQAVAEAVGADLVRAQATTEAEVIEAAAGADGLVVQYAPITAAVLDALPGVRAVGRYGVGVDTVDVTAATARGVAVCNVPDYGTEAVSDHAITLALTVLRAIPALDAGVRAGRPDIEGQVPIPQFAGTTFGVVGYGAIGRATARKAAGLGMDVAVHDVAHRAGTTSEDGFPVLSLPELLARSQVLSLHVPLTDETHHLLDAAALAQLPDRAVVVNTSRGGVVDTDALVDALQSGHVLGAGLDVFETEPLPVGHPLTRFDRVVLTPHAGFYTDQSYAELKTRTITNVIDVVAGRRPRNVLNPEVLAATG